MNYIFLLSVIIFILVIVILFLLKRCINFLQIIDEYRELFADLKNEHQKMYDNMKRLDYSGVFEASDEIGVFFEYAKNILKKINGYFTE